MAALARKGVSATNIDVLGATSGLDEIGRMVDAGKLTVPLRGTFPFEQAAEAIAKSRSGHVRGKIVLTLG